MTEGDYPDYDSSSTFASSDVDSWEDELTPVLAPFATLASIPTTASTYLDAYADQPEANGETDGQDGDTVEAYRTLVRKGEIDGREAIRSVVGGKFEYAIDNGFIEQAHDREHTVTGDKISQFRLTVEGWKKLEEEGVVELERWDSTVEIESVGRDFQIHPTGKGSYKVNTFSVPRYVGVDALWEDGMVRVEPSPEVALVHVRDDIATVVGVE